MVISGLYLETVPGKAFLAAEELAKKEGVEVHHIEEDYKIVITLETETADQSYKIADSFKEIDGILTICLVYSNFEEDPFCQQAADWL
ncbi:chaperone NapD [Robertmurraya andreesenii]|uniref:Chaperone NapD n=1 Tax=Anoxybacillus andreesenii TaxID=1325932 RepID=A0ABT9V6X0_9BACL|nr:chaperone NapD [Robertmurraya andreesenii]MDQ0156697.1 nitrate reductase NapD [Robertmurraya andreesenii]